MFDTVIFDWDGTLADTKTVILASFHWALQEIAGVDVSDEYIERRIGIGARLTFREILKAKDMPIDDTTIERLMEVKIKVQVARAGEVKLFPGALDLLQSLHGKVSMGLASMNNRQVIDHMICALSVDEFFTTVLTSDEVTKSKPDPQIFIKTADKLGSSPSHCVVIEDSIFGVRAAKAAGMACVAVAQGAYSKKELEMANPDMIVDSLREKKAVLSFIFSN